MRKRVLKTEECTGKVISLTDYTHIRAYHACRPLNIQLYQDKGLYPFSRKSALADAIQRLEGGRVSEDKIIEQFNILWKKSDARENPKVWLALEEAELLGYSCHYLIYGSEFLNALAMHLGCRDRLKSIGQPTIVVCDIPLEDISAVWLQDLEKDILNGATEARAIAVPKVQAKNIVSFIYPKGLLNDPFTMSKYKLPNT